MAHCDPPWRCPLRKCRPLQRWPVSGSASPPSGSSCCRRSCLLCACSWLSNWYLDLRIILEPIKNKTTKPAQLKSLVSSEESDRRNNLRNTYANTFFTRRPRAQGYCSLFCLRLRLSMLLMIFSRPLTHCFASPSLAAIRSRFFLRPLKMMEKHRSSSLLWVCLLCPSDWRPLRTESMSSMETVWREEELR